MRNLRRRLITGLILGFIVILVLALLGDIQQVGDHLTEFTWYLAPIILACTLFNYTLRFFKWHFYLAQIGIHDLPWRESARLFVAGFPLAVTPGKIGEALKGVWLNRVAGSPTARGITVVLAERISDGFAVLALSTLGVIAYPKYWPAFVIVLGVLLLGVFLSQIRPLALAVLDWIDRLPLLQHIAHHLREFYEGTYILFRPRATLFAVSLGTLAWLGEGVGMYLVLIGLGIPSGLETFSLAIFVLSFSTVVGAVSTLPGGLVAAEASIAGMLGLLMGLPTSTAVAATLLIRFATLWFGVTLGLGVWAVSKDLLFMEERD
ncbi:MAG TPA: flippase-like domain-containing protein [Anaerolineae bacterium]|nr:flippase-like domain-containing protein [Anaerolineae bacterium]